MLTSVDDPQEFPGSASVYPIRQETGLAPLCPTVSIFSHTVQKCHKAHANLGEQSTCPSCQDMSSHTVLCLGRALKETEPPLAHSESEKYQSCCSLMVETQYDPPLLPSNV